MIYHPVAQQSPEWFKMRIGLATSSCFDKIVTPAKGDFSKSAEEYADQLIGEMVTGENSEKFQSYWMERGASMEAEAAASYQAITEYSLDRGGFLTNDEMTLGASPDRRVLDDSGKVIGGAEIKCPAEKTQVTNLLRQYRDGLIDPSYKPQVQGQILIGKFEFMDWFSYHPKFPPALIRTHRDDVYCQKLESGLSQFLALLDDKMQILRKNGLIIPDRPILAMHRAANDELPDLRAAG